MNEFKKFFNYLAKAAVLAFIVWLPMLGFNVFVDPYGVFFKLFPYTAIEPNKHFMKMNYLQKHPGQFEGIIFGSSRANSLNPAVIPHLKFYNMHYSTSMPYEQLHDLELLIKSGMQVKEILLALDYSSFLETKVVGEGDLLRRPYPENFRQRLRFYKDYLLNNPDWAFIRSNLKRNPMNWNSMYANGMVPYVEKAMSEAQAIEHIQRHDFDKTSSMFQEKPPLGSNMEIIRSFVQYASDNNIRLRIMLHPLHQNTYLSVNLEAYYEAMRQLAQISDFYDFSGLHNVALDNQNFGETSHYYRRIGDLVLSKIYALEKTDIPDDFGVYVTPENVEQRIHEHRRLLQRFFRFTNLAQKYAKPAGNCHSSNQFATDVQIHTFNGWRFAEDSTWVTHGSFVEICGEILSKDKTKGLGVCIDDDFYPFGEDATGPSVSVGNSYQSYPKFTVLLPLNMLRNGRHMAILVFGVSGDTLVSKSIKFYQQSREMALRNLEGFEQGVSDFQAGIELQYYASKDTLSSESETGQIYLKGWARNTKTAAPAAGVIATINGLQYRSQFIVDRFDPREKPTNPRYYSSGWGISLPSAALKPGNNTVSLQIIDPITKTIYPSHKTISFLNSVKLKEDVLAGMVEVKTAGRSNVESINGQKNIKELKVVAVSDKKIRITGWAFDEKANDVASHIYIKLGDHLFPVNYGSIRKDVASHYQNDALAACGFQAEIDATQPGQGRWPLRLIIVAHSKKYFYQVSNLPDIEITAKP